MAVVLNDSSPSAILAELERLLTSPSDFGEEFENIVLGDWASLHIYLPQSDIESAITPPFMEAFLVLQKQLYQFAALNRPCGSPSGEASCPSTTKAMRGVNVAPWVNRGA